jgi:hypothetical protein
MTKSKPKKVLTFTHLAKNPVCKIKGKKKTVSA